LDFKTFLQDKGITQNELAKRLNLSQASISLWVTKKNFPRFETMQKLAVALDVDLQTIIECFVQDEKNAKK